VVAFGPQAEDIRNNVTKGCRVYIEGVLYPEVYQDRDSGKTISRTRVVASSVILLQAPQRPAQVAPHASMTQLPSLPQTDAGQGLDSEWDSLPL
jgi:single-stranded DNA-binding protein